jgi:N utilization substance protein A
MVTKDEQSLAIGKGGQNVRLAAKLTGYKIDIDGSDEDPTDSSDDSYDEEYSDEYENNH